MSKPLIFEDTASNKISFTIENAGFPVEGSLKIIRSEIHFDPGHLENSFIMVTADPNSIETGIEIRNKHLKRVDYFDVDHFPEITINSKKIESLGKNKFIGVFEVTIKKIKKELKVPFVYIVYRNKPGLKGSFSINRLDFNIGFKSLILSDLVNIQVALVLK